MTYTTDKPKNTHYTDYDIVDGNVIAIFEHEDRVTRRIVGQTTLTIDDWRQIKLSETETEFSIIIP